MIVTIFLRLTCLIQEDVKNFLEVIMFWNLISSSMTIGLFRNLPDIRNLPDVMTCKLFAVICSAMVKYHWSAEIMKSFIFS